MKMLNVKMALMMALVIGSTAFVSCSNDDEGGSESGGMSSKRIRKMTYEDRDGIYALTFDYDSQGRIVKREEIEKSYYSEYSSTTTYTYGENTIISKTRGDDNYTCTYTLSNGRIIKAIEEEDGYTYTSNYTYNSDGYLVVLQEENDKGWDMKLEFTWNDGNLMETERNHFTVTSSYSDIAWPQNWIQFLLDDEAGIDITLEPLGVWGKMPKKLPSKYVLVSEEENNICDIDYTIENGVITKVIQQWDTKIHGHYDDTIITIEWE